ncbi:carbohydrate ABC transporter permease [Mesomycoplasma hyorhinis]|uniref:carbohydrate ABC transporter permease n=1 Tax=Mesomycoplasma hyorhinis TaxID=2100 RepID=UPI0004864EBE|nr:sugar ABC transporter permease [Mesomycoplasma hyorhinis]
MNLWYKLRLKLLKKQTHFELGILYKQQKFWKPFLLLLPSILIILLFTLLPFIYAVKESVILNEDENNKSLVHFGFSAFSDVLEDPFFQLGIRNSTIFAIVSLPITLMISLLISSTIASIYRKWVRGFWQTIFFLPYVTSGIAVSLAFSYVFATEGGFVNNLFNSKTRWLNSGDANSFYALVVILFSGIWRSLAFQVLILTTAMLSVNPTLYKAASIDGASSFKQFFKITLPSVSRTINFLITMGIIGGIKVFPIGIFSDADIAQSNGGSTILLYIYKQVRSSNFTFAGVSTIYLFIYGLALSIVLKKGINTILLIIWKLGERNVRNKIKASHFLKK